MHSVPWIDEAVFYHVYPLGYCGAPKRNDRSSNPIQRLAAITADLDRIKELGCTCLYLGPVFESWAHGYDPLSWTEVDRRLGDRESLKQLARELKARGMRLVFDAVFNHTGREHPWFLALRGQGSAAPSSAEARRYAGIRGGSSPCGDPFQYEGWAGHYDLAKLNLKDQGTRSELINAALSWIEDYDIDGLRLDAADCLDMDFLNELSEACRRRKPDFWLMGEVVFGDYRKWLCGPLDSITNYECYKGLWSSFKDENLFELAWSLKRQFGPEGIYQGMKLYSFADNHDVARVASLVKREDQLYPLYCILFTMPGLPSIYYGSERGAKGQKEGNSDWALRPSLQDALASGCQPDLEATIRRLSALRKNCRPLQSGSYRELAVGKEELVFERRLDSQSAIVAINGKTSKNCLELNLGREGQWRDLLDGGSYRSVGGKLRLEVPGTWARVLVSEN